MPLTMPTTNIEWASTLQADPISGQNNRSEPPAGTKTYGYDFAEQPPRQWANWWRNEVYNWIKWIQQEINNPGTYGASGLGTAAGRDIGTDNTNVPEFDTNKGLAANRINASYSGLTDTGEVTTTHTRQVNASSTCQATQSLSQINASDDCGISATCQQAQINASDGIEIAPSTKTNLQVNVSTGACVVSGNMTQINACDGACVASGDKSQVNASGGACEAAGNYSQVNVSYAACTTSAIYSQINASTNSTIGANANEAQINASDNCLINPGSSVSSIQINCSINGCTATNDCSQVNASNDCDAAGVRSQINCSVASCATSTDSSQINASSDCNITSSNAYVQVNASTGSDCTTNSNISQINACINSIIDGSVDVILGSNTCMMDQYSCVSAIIASINSELLSSSTTNYRAIIACNDCDMSSTGEESIIAASNACDNDSSGDRNAIISCEGCIIDSTYGNNVLLASKYIKAGASYRITGGHNSSGPAASANRKWEIDSVNGDINIVGSFDDAWSPSDFGEMFENLKQKVISLGTIVALSEDKIRPGVKGDRILGVVSATTAFLGNTANFCWQGRYLKGEFGEPIYEEIPDPEFKGKKKDAPLIKVRKENPDFDIERENISRRDRPDEWSAVALLGQTMTRLKEDVCSGDYVDADGSKSETPTRLECMKITQKFTKKKGYAVGLCLIR